MLFAAYITDGYTDVAFYAKVGDDHGELGHTETIVFDIVRTNNGGHYDPSTGKFTAPVSGTYQFTATILSGYDEAIETMLVVNDSEIARIFSGGYLSQGSGSNSIIVNLNKGDTVAVQVFYSQGDYISGQWSSFSGHLLAPVYY